ncbi:MAG: YqaJ viral recombinase family protein, partial [Candidatus Thiodiazotropha sp.]
MASIHGAKKNYCKTETVTIQEQSNYFQLSGHIEEPDMRHLKQRTSKWFELRKTMRVTGSTMNRALGLDSLRKQQDYFDEVVHKKTSENHALNPKVAAAMDYGVRHEPDAIATLVGRVLPAFFPDLVYVEEGCATISEENCPFYLSSPDGSIRQSPADQAQFMYETKCKPPNDQTTSVYYEIPKYYVMQILGEMRSYECERLLFTVWSEQSTVVFETSFCEEIWDMAWNECCKIYDVNCPRRPSKVSKECVSLKSRITQYLQKNCKVVCEVPSLKTSDINTGACSDTLAYDYYWTPKEVTKTEENITCDTMLSTLFHLDKWLKHTYELNRSLASEILVFMVNDLNRQYHFEISNSHPIAYAMKGSSLPANNFRQMVDHVIAACESKGLPILVICTDGQWARYGARDFDEQPLTVLQVQRDTWKEAKSETKQNLQKWLKGLNFVNTENENALAQICILKDSGNNNRLIVGGLISTETKPKTSSSLLKVIYQGIKRKTTLVAAQDKSSQEMLTDPITSTVTAAEEILQTLAKEKTEADTDVLLQLDSLFDDALISEEVEAGLLETVTLEDCGNTLCSFIEELSITNIREDTDTINTINEETKETSNADAILLENSCNLNNTDYLMMLREVQTVDPGKRWLSISVDEFKNLFKSYASLDKAFCKKAVKACVRAVQGIMKIFGITSTLSRSKQDMVESLLLLAKTNDTPITKRKAKTKSYNPKSLRTLCIKQTVQRYSKEVLSILKAECTFTKKLNDWKRTKSQICHGVCIEDFSSNIQWFSQPELCRDGKVRFHFVDARHILTCLRTKI